METKSTKQTFNGYTNWQTKVVVNWALEEQALSHNYTFEQYKDDFEISLCDIPEVFQDLIDTDIINWDEIKEAMEGEE